MLRMGEMMNFLKRIALSILLYCADRWLPEVEDSQSQFEVQLSSTFWRLFDDIGNVIPGDVTGKIILVDDEKVQELVKQHLNDSHRESPSWEVTEGVIDHVLKEHFDEVKLDKPRKVLFAKVDHTVTVCGVRNLISESQYRAKTSRCMIDGDQMYYTIKELEWDDI